MEQVTLKGISGARGVGTGTVYVYKQEAIVIEKRVITAAEVEAEISALESAIQLTIEQLKAIEEHARATMGKDEAAIFEAHGLIVQDPTSVTALKGRLKMACNRPQLLPNRQSIPLRICSWPWKIHTCVNAVPILRILAIG